MALSNIDHFRGVLLRFALLCVPFRLLIVYFDIKFQETKFKALKITMGVLGLIVGIGFMYLHFSGTRPYSVAGDKAWWNRMVHSLFYLTFGMWVLMGRSNAYLFLLGDVVYGVVSFVVHHILNGDFQKLLM